MSKHKYLHTLVVSVSVPIGTLTAIGLPVESAAAVIEMTWQGSFTMLNVSGDPLMNSSINQKVANQYITPISGTLNYDTQEGNGSLAVMPFAFMGSSQDEPFTVKNATFELIGDGMGGPGSLMLGNMMYDWNFNRNVSFSIVWDASGMLQGINDGLTSIEGVGSAPSVDSSYTPYNGGTFLNLGASPVATTTFNTTNVAGCVNLDCIGYNPSGTLPLIVDTAINENKTAYSSETVYGIGGSLIQDSGFQFKSLNFDMTTMQVVAISEVPVPAAVWLFGSGLLGLIGVARKKIR